MPQVLDEFVIQVGLDPAKFGEGRRALDDEVNKGLRATEAFGKGIERQGAKISEIFGITKTGVAGIVATFMGAEAGVFVEHIRSMEASTSRLADSIGVNRRELALWQNMVGLVGGNAEDASQTIAGLNDALQSYRAGLAQPSPGFAQLMSQAGVNYLNPNVTPTDVLQQITQFLSGRSEPQRRLPLQQVPSMDNSMMMLLLKGAADIAKFNEQMRKFSSRAQEAGDAAQDMDKSIGRISAALRGFAHTLLPDLAKELDWLANVITGKYGGLIASVGGGASFGATSGAVIGGIVGSVVPGIGTVGGLVIGGLWGTLAGGIAGGLTYETSKGQSPAVPSGSSPSSADVEAYIRRSAISHGKGKSSLNIGAVGDRGTSFGVFQLHKGGLADDYEKNTGHLASFDSRFWQDQIDFSMAAARSTGWTPRHAWHGQKWQGIAPLGQKTGGANTTNNISISKIEVISNKADPKAVADQIPDAVRRSSMVNGMTTGLT